MAIFRGLFFENAVFPFSHGKNRISQGVENRGSLISVPLGLRETFHREGLQGWPRVGYYSLGDKRAVA